MKLSVRLLAWGGIFAGILTARGQTVFTWSSAPTSGAFELPANWINLAAPTAGSALRFGPTTIGTVVVPASLSLASIAFEGSALSYTFNGTGSPVFTVGASGISIPNTSSAWVEFGATMGLALGAPQTWTVGPSSVLKVSGRVSGSSGLTKSGAGILQLGGANDFTGGLTIRQGEVSLLANGAIGGTTAVPTALTMNPAGTDMWATLGIGATQQTIGTLTFGGAGGASGVVSTIYMDSTGRLNLTGDVTYDSSSLAGPGQISGGALVLSGNRRFQIADSPNAWSDLYIGSAIQGAGATLTKTGAGTLELAGTNSYTGGTVVNGGTLRVSTASGGLPAGGNVVVNSTGVPAVLDLNGTQTIGSLTFGGTGGAAKASNAVRISPSGKLAVTGITYDSTTLPGQAEISGGAIVLGGVVPAFNIGNSPNAGIDLVIHSAIEGTTGLGKTGSGTLVLTGPSTFAGGVTVGSDGGTLLVGGSTMRDTGGQIVSGPLGKGSLMLYSGAVFGGTQAFGAPDDLEIGNHMQFSNVTFGQDAQTRGPALKFSGLASLGEPATTVQLAPGQDVFFTGSLGAEGAATLTFRGTAGTKRGAAVLSGSTTNLSKVTADQSAVVIGGSAALPTALAANNGYIGVATVNASQPPSAFSVLAKIDQTSFTGTFGLDTHIEAMPAHVYRDTLDMARFTSGSMALGSMSRAIFEGSILPSSEGYSFGGGGGGLIIRSPLTDAGGTVRPVTVGSAVSGRDARLYAVLQGANTFTGSLSVTNSAAILDSPGALPALPTTRSVSLGANGYLGYTENFSAVPNFGGFAARVTSHVPTSILGLDSRDWIAAAFSGVEPGPAAGRFVSETIDLTSKASIYLGTATRAILAGPVLAPNQDGARKLSLIGIGEGTLEVRSNLTAGNVNQVVVGSSGTAHAVGTVVLSGDNTFAGGTTLNSGTLLLGSSSWTSVPGVITGPLGSGPLNVPNSTQTPVLGSTGWAHVANPLSLGGPLQLGGVNESEYDYNWLLLEGAISDLAPQVGSLRIQGGVELSGANTFSGGVFLERGTLGIGSDSALGTGVFTINPAPSDGSTYGNVSISLWNGPRTIQNRVVLNSPGEGYLGIYGDGSLTIAGEVVLNGNLRLGSGDHSLYLNGPVTGPGTLQSGWGRPIIVNHTANTYTGGTYSEYGGIVFGSGASVPAAGLLKAEYDGYIGVATPPAGVQASFVDRFDKTLTSGTLGFDTLTATSPNVFSGPIDLTNFHPSARLGSSTRAILQGGSITPQAGTYNFGGGGGVLDVNIPLADAAGARGVSVSSGWETPLTVRLNATNSYTGDTTVNHSALIFKAGALPAAGKLSGTGGGYIGTEDAALAPATFIGRFATSTYDTIIGFDTATSTPANVTAALDLSQFSTTTDPRIFLGSATSASISGAITLPPAQTAYRFAGYKGGLVTVSTVLGGTKGVEIGDSDNLATFRSPVIPDGPLSTVVLSGANAYSGGTIFHGGALGLGHNSALGTGTLTIDGMQYHPMWRPVLFASGARSIANPILLNSDLEVGRADALQLTGNISAGVSEYAGDTHQIFKTGTGMLTLSGNNTFDGGVLVEEGSVSFASATAAGTGMLYLGGTTTATSATFPVTGTVHGISGYNNLSLINVGAASALTINQTEEASYYGKFTLGTGASLVYKGPDPLDERVLWLHGDSTYTGTTRIGSGIVVVGAVNNAFGASTSQIQLEGGTLAIIGGVTVSNPLTLNSGTLAGSGTFQTATTLQIKDQVALAPGAEHGTGTLTFQPSGTFVGSELLSLASGGTYRWQLGDATNLASGSDRIVVSSGVGVTATTLAPFNFKIAPAVSADLITPAMIFDPMQSYSWTVLTANSILGFDPTKFRIDTSAIAGLMGGGAFSLSANATSLLLNFTPVPEPSTYALFGIGAVVLFLAHRRRRR